MSKPRITRTKHLLPFNELSSGQFERLCLWLMKGEGYILEQDYGGGGSDKGRDVTAYKPTATNNELWYFQCKRRKSLGATLLKEEVAKIDKATKKDKKIARPVGIVFVTNAVVSAKARDDVIADCEALGYRCEFWAHRELDRRVKAHLDIVSEFFTEAPIITAPHHPEDRIYIGRLPKISSELFGRDRELGILNKAWAKRETNIVTFVALGGIGKSALVNRWLNEMRAKNYRGAEKVFGDSFYSQGTSDQATSADLFVASALGWFGDPKPEQGNPEDKGKRLAKLIQKHRVLLILDGLEPLQYPVAERKGRLKHPGIARLVYELATCNPGLCVISSRLPVTDLSSFIGTSVQQVDLEKLSAAAGRLLLKAQGADGSDDEMERASDDFGGHALALSILGNFLKMVAGGNIRQRDRIGELSHHPERGGHARRVIESYACWFQDDPKHQVEFQSLRLLGLFDRPIDPGAWRTLIEKPAIKGLTDHISNANETRRRIALGVLRDAHLLAAIDSNSTDTVDCHPLIREHFGEELKDKHPDAWKQAHKRLFKFYFRKKELPETVEEMAPYYQAITHASLAGLHREAFVKVYTPYIRQDSAYNTDKLRAFEDDLAALTRFLKKDQFTVVKKLNDHGSFILGEIGFDLRALGRLDEALDAMRAALVWDKAQEHPDHRINASRQADVLSATYLIRGFVKDALKVADDAVELAEGDDYHRMICLTTRAEAKYRAGDLDGAGKDFVEAESINKRIFSSKGWPYLRSFQGHRYCDYLLTKKCFGEVKRRVKKTVVWDELGGYPTPPSSRPLHFLQTEGRVLPLALDHLMFARVLLVRIRGNERRLREAETHLNKALKGIEDSSTRHLWPKGVLVHAELLRSKGESKEAEKKLVECLSICARDKMRLYEADCRFELACLHLKKAEEDRAVEAVNGAVRDLEKVEKMADELGYGLLKERIARLLAHRIV